MARLTLELRSDFDRMNHIPGAPIKYNGLYHWRVDCNDVSTFYTDAYDTVAIATQPVIHGEFSESLAQIICCAELHDEHPAVIALGHFVEWYRAEQQKKACSS